MSTISAGTTSGTALVSTGNTDGTLQLQVNGTTPSVTLATTGAIGVGSTPGYGTSGQVLTSAGSGAAPTWTTVSSGFTLGTPVATTSGTSIDFTGIPAGVKKITITPSLVGTNGTSNLLVQLGDSGGIETTGYSSNCGYANSGQTVTVAFGSTGFILRNTGASTSAISGSLELTLENASTNTWVCSGVTTDTDTTSISMTAGRKALSAVLDRVRLTTVNGTDSFDAGEVNIVYL